jgi:hypothetical protein
MTQFHELIFPTPFADCAFYQGTDLKHDFCMGHEKFQTKISRMGNIPGKFKSRFLDLQIVGASYSGRKCYFSRWRIGLIHFQRTPCIIRFSSGEHPRMHDPVSPEMQDSNRTAKLSLFSEIGFSFDQFQAR